MIDMSVSLCILLAANSEEDESMYNPMFWGWKRLIFLTFWQTYSDKVMGRFL